MSKDVPRLRVEQDDIPVREQHGQPPALVAKLHHLRTSVRPGLRDHELVDRLFPLVGLVHEEASVILGNHQIQRVPAESEGVGLHVEHTLATTRQ